MTADYPTAQVPATPEYVLEVLRAVFDGSELPDGCLTFDTPVRDLIYEWTDAYFFWWEFVRPLNVWMALDLDWREWESVLSPKRGCTVRDLCDFVARKMVARDVIRPWKHVAGDCLPAGAFLTVRSMLARVGVDSQAITPSTELAPYMPELTGEMGGRLFRLAPGRIPNPEDVFRPWPVGCGVAAGLVSAILTTVLATILLVAGIVSVSPVVVLVSFLGLVLSVRSVRWFNRLSQPVGVHLGELRTFRDLAYCLAGQESRRRIQTSP